MSAVCFEKYERKSKTPIRPPARQVWPRRATATAASNSTKKSESTRARSKYAPLAWYVAAKRPAATRPATASPVSRRTSCQRSASTPSEARKDTSRGARKPTPSTLAKAAEIQMKRGGYGYGT